MDYMASNGKIIPSKMANYGLRRQLRRRNKNGKSVLIEIVNCKVKYCVCFHGAGPGHLLFRDAMGRILRPIFQDLNPSCISLKEPKMLNIFYCD